MNAVAEYVEKHGIRNIDLAVGMEISPGHAHNIVSGKTPVTPLMAVLFARFIGKPKSWRDYVSEPEGV